MTESTKEAISAAVYGCPPGHTKFKKGQSGNLSGRPKQSQALTEMLAAELNQLVPITLAGRIKYISKREALVKLIVDGALEGDVSAIEMLVDLIQEVSENRGFYKPAEVVITKREMLI